MGRYKWALIGTLIALALVVVVVGAVVASQMSNSWRWGYQFSRSISVLATACETRSSELICQTWAEAVVNTDIARTDVILECDNQNRKPDLFIDCLTRNGIYTPNQ